jgi:hypothetical protein
MKAPAIQRSLILDNPIWVISSAGIRQVISRAGAAAL